MIRYFSILTHYVSTLKQVTADYVYRRKNNRFHFNSRCYTDNGMCLLYEVHIVVNIRDHSWVTKLTNQFSRVMFVVLCVSVPCHCCARVAMMPTSLSRVASEVVAMTKLTSWWLRAVIIPTLSSLALKPPLVSSMTKKVGTVTAPVYQWRDTIIYQINIKNWEYQHIF